MAHRGDCLHQYNSGLFPEAECSWSLKSINHGSTPLANTSLQGVKLPRTEITTWVAYRTLAVSDRGKTLQKGRLFVTRGRDLFGGMRFRASPFFRWRVISILGTRIRLRRGFGRTGKRSPPNKDAARPSPRFEFEDSAKPSAVSNSFKPLLLGLA